MDSSSWSQIVSGQSTARQCECELYWISTHLGPRGVSDGAEKLTHQTQAGSFPGKRTSMSPVSCCKCRPALDMSINSGGCRLRQRKRDLPLHQHHTRGCNCELEQRVLSGGRADTSSYCTTALSQRSFPLSVLMTNPETSNLANSGA